MSGPAFSGFATLTGALRSLVRELPRLAPALLVVALLLCLLLPLPTPVVDLLLSLSLASAVLMLVAGLRVGRATEFLAFPTLVLLLTLYRLALNVSTTRLILSQADAGRVIDAFANLVVRGDLLVGAVMFAVITAIQYFVIARGAERVAEVAARFALDGMPGQQAAIDADLRAGAISPREARVRRELVSERSSFFARMDGVMRWVKGDAIVGLLITGINLVGGVAVGGLRGGLGIGESLALYGKLAIGDGLLAQLPALLIALAAAVLVARVDRVSEQPRAPWLEPGMLLIPALLLGVLAPVPGMPTLAFSTCAVGLLAAALWIAARGLEREPARVPEQVAGSGSLRARPRLGQAVIRVRARLSEGEAAALAQDLVGLRQRCALALGVPIPQLVVEPSESGSSPAKLAAAELELRLGERVLGRTRTDAMPTSSASQSGASGRRDALLLACFHVLMDNAARLVTLEQIEAGLESAARRQPTRTRQAMHVVEPVDLLAIVRGFVRERIPSPSMDALIEVLAEHRVFRDVAERRHWPEHARERLADHWLRDLCDAVAELGEPQWLRPSPDAEELVLARAQLGDARVSLALSAERQAELVAQLIGAPAARARTPRVVICSSRARPAFAALLDGVRPHVPVLSVGEFAAAKVALPQVVTVDFD